MFKEHSQCENSMITTRFEDRAIIFAVVSLQYTRVTRDRRQVNPKLGLKFEGISF